MHRRGLLSTVAALAVAGSTSAWAEPKDSASSPPTVVPVELEGSTYAPSPPSPVVARTEAPKPPPKPPPTMSERLQLRAGGELGWNSLTGLGGVMSATPLPRIELDAGVGLSALGWRAGARLRFTPLTGQFRPFVGAGLSLSLGTLWNTASLETDGNTVRYKVKVSPNAQLVGGFEFLDSSGWSFLVTGGVARSLRASNYEIVEGTPNQTQRDVFDLLYGDGIVISIGIGKLLP